MNNGAKEKLMEENMNDASCIPKSGCIQLCFLNLQSNGIRKKQKQFLRITIRSLRFFVAITLS